MSPTKRGWLAIAALATLAVGTQLTPATAQAEPTPPSPTTSEQPAPDVLHNITYRARIDGISRGATITYTANGDQTQTATPTMVPGRTFEANTVLPASQQADVRVSIDWPYSANLHCEILVDDALVAQADDFIGPRLKPARDDPNYGALRCEAPVSGIANTIPPSPDDIAPPPPPPPAG